MPKANGLLVGGIALGLGLYLASRRKEMTSGVILGGGISGINVEMATHMVPKTAGEPIHLTVNWNANTLDKSTKLLVPWPYWLRIRLGHSTLFGWKDAAELGFPVTGTHNYFSPLYAGAQQTGSQFTTPNDPNQTWDIHVELFARTPLSGTNTPDPDTTKWTSLTPEPVKHDGAVLSKSAGVDVGGSITSIAVAQRRHSVGRMGL